MEDEEEVVSFAPGGDADYFAEEDDEGRFFGGGLTSEQKDILNIFEKAEGGSMDDTVSKHFCPSKFLSNNISTLQGTRPIHN